MTPGFWLTLGSVVARSIGCCYVVAKARRQGEQVHREVARLEAEIEKTEQALDDERRR